LDRAALDSESAAIDKGPAELVTLATIAAAKGLEWKATFLAGCEEGLLPQSEVKGNLEELDAERRLFYVGVTRAKQRLTLTAATGRVIDSESSLREVSRFVRESAQHLTLDEDARSKMARPLPPPRSTLASMRSPEG
jgi:DNA helicase-2/ATP-dependent DNA helicase PcrA